MKLIWLPILIISWLFFGCGKPESLPRKPNTVRGIPADQYYKRYVYQESSNEVVIAGNYNRIGKIGVMLLDKFDEHTFALSLPGGDQVVGTWKIDLNEILLLKENELIARGMASTWGEDFIQWTVYNTSVFSVNEDEIFNAVTFPVEYDQKEGAKFEQEYFFPNKETVCFVGETPDKSIRYAFRLDKEDGAQDFEMFKIREGRKVDSKSVDADGVWKIENNEINFYVLEDGENGEELELQLGKGELKAMFGSMPVIKFYLRSLDDVEAGPFREASKKWMDLLRLPEKDCP